MIYEFSSHEAMIKLGPKILAFLVRLSWWCRFYAQNNSPRRLPSRQTGFLGHDSAQEEPGRPGPLLYITNASLERYKLNQGKPGPRPGFRQRLIHAADRTLRNVWPDG